MLKQPSELQQHTIPHLSNEETNRITKERIEQALLLLIKNQALDKISITDIVKQAGVSRTAYYRNYTSKENILQSMLHDVVQDITKTMQLEGQSVESYEYWYAMFRLVKKHSNSLGILFKTDHGDIILHEINRQIQALVKTADTTERYKHYFFCGAAYNVLAAWLHDGMVQPVDEMARLCCTFSNPCPKQE
ncbi:TetR family transcriptional regulator [Clostridia bacterium OttesenSCG-928-F22]|nr:TetR family transcriptional regulator [Clostridia bacterium OttesenSCG-928-F22]